MENEFKKELVSKFKEDFKGNKEYTFTRSKGPGNTETYTKLGKDLVNDELDLLVGQHIKDYEALYKIVMKKVEQAFKDQLILGRSEIKIEDKEPSETIKEIYRRNFGKSSGF